MGTVARSLIACGCVGLAGLAYVWEKNQLYRLGDELKKREAALLAVDKRNAMLAAQLAHLKSPAYLEARCQQYNLGLVAPRETQIVRLLEPGPEWDVTLPAAAAQPLQRPSPTRRSTSHTVARR